MTTDKEIIEKIVRWLELNIKVFNSGALLDTDLLTDNKNLLKAIKDWKKEKTMTNEEKCKVGVYDSVNVVIIRLKKILSDYKISKKVRNSLEDIRDNNWQGKNDNNR
jgi:hypothetical protein